LKLTTSQWTSVLDLAQIWGFEDVRKVVIESLVKIELDLITKAVLASKYEVVE
jgi:hypothetical protein